MRRATTSDVDEARQIIGWITARGCHRGSDLAAVLARRMRGAPEPGA